jgi:3-methyladenine DNA glycosylase AlkD
MNYELRDLLGEIKKLHDPERARVMQRFFKAGKGEYGEGDVFVGLSVPQMRKLASKYKDLGIADIETLLHSKIHEERLISLFLLVQFFNQSDPQTRREIVKFYLKNTKYINNWDLVDSSADKILGEYLQGKPIDILEKLARSESLWERRIAMIATFQFLKNGISGPTLSIAEMLIDDTHDLIQKAVGWMLRESGKRCGEEVEEEFLKKHYKRMGRTALRYAIERFETAKRKAYLLGEV